MLVSEAIDRLFELIMLLLIIKVFLSWVPNIKWYNEPFATLNRFSEVFFGPFRKIIPPIGMIDISPIVAFLTLGIIQQIVHFLLVNLGI